MPAQLVPVGPTVAADVPEDKVIVFADGIPGLPRHKRFAIFDLAPDSPFHVLRSVEDPAISMIVTVPWVFFPDYSFELSDLEQANLGLEAPGDAVVFCSVLLDADRKDTVYLNLLGPFVVNYASLKGCQLVLAGSGQPLRAPVTLPRVAD
jgi:flagellar assembly factor FliW